MVHWVHIICRQHKNLRTNEGCLDIMETFTLIPSEKKVNQNIVYECENFPDDAINRDSPGGMTNLPSFNNQQQLQTYCHVISIYTYRRSQIPIDW